MGAVGDNPNPIWTFLAATTSPSTGSVCQEGTRPNDVRTRPNAPFYPPPGAQLRRHSAGWYRRRRYQQRYSESTTRSSLAAGSTGILQILGCLAAPILGDPSRSAADPHPAHSGLKREALSKREIALLEAGVGGSETEHSVDEYLAVPDRFHPQFHYMDSTMGGDGLCYATVMQTVGLTAQKGAVRHSDHTSIHVAGSNGASTRVE